MVIIFQNQTSFTNCGSVQGRHLHIYGYDVAMYSQFWNVEHSTINCSGQKHGCSSSYLMGLNDVQFICDKKTKNGWPSCGTGCEGNSPNECVKPMIEQQWFTIGLYDEWSLNNPHEEYAMIHGGGVQDVSFECAAGACDKILVQNAARVEFNCSSKNSCQNIRHYSVGRDDSEVVWENPAEAKDVKFHCKVRGSCKKIHPGTSTLSNFTINCEVSGSCDKVTRKNCKNSSSCTLNL